MTAAAPTLAARVSRLGALIAVVTLAGACGGGSDEASGGVVLRTQGDIAVDQDEVADTTTSVAGAADDEAEPAADDASAETETTTSTTLPQEEETAGEALFTAIGVFQSCLDANGYEFIGLPDPSNPDAPQNAQAYIDALIDCAARSQIQERLAEADAAQVDLTPEEVETQNRQYVAFRECMIGRGWDIPDPVPNEYGLLFPGFQAAASWEGPPGEDITSTDDVGECTDTAGVEVGADS